MPRAKSAAPSPRTRLRRFSAKARYDLPVIEAIIDAMPVAHIGHLVDGAPVVTPTLIWREGGRIFWHGSSASRMQRAAAGAQVCVTVTLVDGMVLARSGFEHSVNFRSAMIFGTAQELTDPAEKAQALQVMVERLFPGRWETLRPMTAQEVKATSVLSLPLTEASAKIGDGFATESPEDQAWPAWAGILPITYAMGAPRPDPTLAAGVELPDHVASYRFGQRPEQA